jgi:hypothetical protein
MPALLADPDLRRPAISESCTTSSISAIRARYWALRRRVPRARSRILSATVMFGNCAQFWKTTVSRRLDGKWSIAWPPIGTHLAACQTS